ncbi:hypothetical protein F0562_013290 [Nyssa sinensis]|uniref:UBX domain-containing protein n=1 Tax=Nyssa sinensis TaxID=561372 RepID=A0A5J4ZW97_9ASTE|nr:hypothetical protein F0562_013290 [Nyssa sinensis]
MAKPNQEAIETFMNITGVPEAVAVQKLEEHGGNLNAAVNAHFGEGDRNITHETSNAAPQDDFMDIDDPIQVESLRPFSLLPTARNMNPFSLLDANLSSSLFDSGPDLTSRGPFVSHPREVREIPIEVKDGTEQSGHSGLAPTIEDVTGAEQARDSEIHGTVIFDDEEDIPVASAAHTARQNDRKDDVLGDSCYGTHPRPSAPGIHDLPGYGNDIEEEMIRAAIEASKRDVEQSYPKQLGPINDLSGSGSQQRQSQLDDSELAQAVSLSLKTAEQEKALRELGEKVGGSELEAYKSPEVRELGKLASTNGRLEVGSSSIQDEVDDVEEQPLVRHRSRHMSSGSVESAREIGSLPSSPELQNNVSHPPPNGNDFHSDEWGGISSEEHDEAVMLEAALFGGIPEGSGYRFPYAPHQLMQNDMDRTVGPSPWRIPRPPSPTLTAQRLIREQQDDEYLASLQADREKELKAMEEAEARRLKEQAAREAALEEERQREEEISRKLEEEREVERQLAAKEASLPLEPTSDDENACNSSSADARCPFLTSLMLVEGSSLVLIDW